MTVLAFLLAAVPARAADPAPFTYAPEGCEFKIEFPDAPYTAKRCHPDFPDRCETITGFTKVFDLSVTMNFYVSCKPSTPETFESYTEDILRTTLIGMAGRGRIGDFQTAFDADENVRRGSLLGAGPSYNGRNGMLYIGQIWAGRKSVMTVEGELIGEAGEDTDRAFAEILKTIGVNEPEKAPEEKEKKEEEAAPEKKEP